MERKILRAFRYSGFVYDLEYEKILHKELIVRDRKTKYVHVKGLKDLQVKYIDDYESLIEIIFENSQPKYIRLFLGGLLFLKREFSSLFDIKIVSNDVKKDFSPLSFENDFKIESEIESLPTFKNTDGSKRQYFYDIHKICFEQSIGIIKAPTGTGKSMITINLSWNYSNLIGFGFIFVPTKVILNDFISKFNSFNIPFETLDSVFQKDIKTLDDLEKLNKIIILCPKAFNSNKIFCIIENEILLDNIKWIIYDECQWCYSKTYSKFLSCKNLSKSFGFSATPFSSIESYNLNIPFVKMPRNDAFVRYNLGGIIYELKQEESKEFLNSVSFINFYYYWKDSKVLNKMNHTSNWKTISSLVQENKDRFDTIVKIIKILSEEKNRRIICHNTYKKNSIQIQENLKNNKSVLWFGGNNIFTENKEKIKQDVLLDLIKTNQINTILGTSHLVEGFNLEGCQLNSIILCDGKLERITIQKIGRVMRKSELSSVVINIIDVGCKILNFQGIKRGIAIRNEFPNIDFFEIKSLKELEEFLKNLN